jgi:hypothetical protein
MNVSIGDPIGSTPYIPPKHLDLTHEADMFIKDDFSVTFSENSVDPKDFELKMAVQKLQGTIAGNIEKIKGADNGPSDYDNVNGKISINEHKPYKSNGEDKMATVLISIDEYDGVYQDYRNVKSVNNPGDGLSCTIYAKYETSFFGDTITPVHVKKEIDRADFTQIVEYMKKGDIINYTQKCIPKS